ncbi:MAG: tetratricopeptide repeat protein [Desulfocapsa sp.]|nr:tetratricopeptide repeat protein [Desulfocapsa sp.]
MSQTVSGSTPSPQELIKQFNHACKLHENNKIREAIDEYKSLLILLPDSPLLHFNCALAHFDIHQFNEAEKHYREACQITPEDPDVHYNRGLNFRRLGKIKEGAESFAQAVKLGDSSVDTLYSLALCYQDLHDNDGAALSYELILSRDPNHLSTLNNYAYLCHKIGESKKAEKLYRRLLRYKPDHQAAQHMINSLSGQTPDSAPLDYVETVFDNYAKDFEDSLLGRLQYKTPMALWDRYCHFFREVPRKYCLDLGCGTGLAGVQFAPCCSHMVGVDISEEMLAVANEKNLYNELKKDDISHFLCTAQPFSFDLIIAADVFIYLGDLKKIFTACFEKTKEGGVFLFSVEESTSEQFEIKETGRFGHSTQYIQNLCQKTGWSILDMHPSNLRQEKEEWIKGYLFILHK